MSRRDPSVVNASRILLMMSMLVMALAAALHVVVHGPFNLAA